MVEIKKEKPPSELISATDELPAVPEEVMVKLARDEDFRRLIEKIRRKPTGTPRRPRGSGKTASGRSSAGCAR